METRKNTQAQEQKARFQIEKLEERIAPTVTGTGGYEGQPGTQSSAPGNPSGSATPENRASLGESREDEQPERSAGPLWGPPRVALLLLGFPSQHRKGGGVSSGNPPNQAVARSGRRGEQRRVPFSESQFA
jgi:hypothetical protein